MDEKSTLDTTAEKIFNVKSTEEAALLHTPCTPVTQEDKIKDAKKSIMSIFEKRIGTCLGVAAPQVGVSKCFFLGQFGLNKNSVFPRKELNRLKYKNAVFMINPKITFKSEHTNTHMEGCLSIDKVMYMVPRPIRVSVEYLNVDFKKVSAVLCGWDAYVFMHEFDHLNGITIDQVPGAVKLEIKEQEPEKIDIPLPSEMKEEDNAGN